MDFYVLAGDAETARLDLACRLAEKAVARAYRVYLHAPSASEAERFDELLWTFRDTSFVPHALAGPPRAEKVPVLIGHEAATAGEFLDGAGDAPTMLINLCDAVPDFYNRFARVAEVVDADAGRRRLGRDRFRRYREQGCAIETHEMSSVHG